MRDGSVSLCPTHQALARSINERENMALHPSMQKGEANVHFGSEEDMQCGTECLSPLSSSQRVRQYLYEKLQPHHSVGACPAKWAGTVRIHGRASTTLVEMRSVNYA